uniref:Uncharacterized protein n=1 Tax=Panagrolaimus davidi TaxID=227884 RepID=A0A914QXM6_9BILA
MSKIFFFELLLISGITADIDFYHLCGGDMLAKPGGGSNSITYPALEDALDICAQSTTCIGVNGTIETGFGLLINFRNIKLNGPSFDYYLADRSSGQFLPNAPSDLDIKIFFAIYPINSCPSQMVSNGTICVGNAKITQAMCADYPDYLHATFNLATNKCEAATKEQIIATWS